jgi:hypothetical protein
MPRNAAVRGISVGPPPQIPAGAARFIAEENVNLLSAILRMRIGILRILPLKALVLLRTVS